MGEDAREIEVPDGWRRRPEEGRVEAMKDRRLIRVVEQHPPAIVRGTDLVTAEVQAWKNRVLSSPRRHNLNVKRWRQ
jgi:hypothetical protein